MKMVILLVLSLVVLSMCVYAENITLSNKNMTLTLKEQNKKVFVTTLRDNVQNVDFIGEPNPARNIWMLNCKKDKDFAGKEIWLDSTLAEDITIDQTKTKATIVWKNVKTAEMASGFDVTCSIELVGENSYWDMSISSNPEYGVWNVTYPYINDLDAQDGDEYLYPIRGNGHLYTVFSDERGFINRGARADADEKDKYSKVVGYPSPCNIFLQSLTKEKSTLYISPEDSNFQMKSMEIFMEKPNHLDFYSKVSVPNMGVANTPYKQNYRFNLSIIKGDWYNAAKKYRKWGIDAKLPVFAWGEAYSRKDLPEWLKYNVAWLRWVINQPNTDDHIIESQKYLGVKCAAHVYHWVKNEYDTHYPNWLPAKDEFGIGIKKLQEAGIPVMPYTNGHLVDRNLSDYYKQYGDELLALNENGKADIESWSQDKGADNACACINSKYSEAYMNEVINIMKLYNFDALYMDQIGATPQRLCFNPLHSHSMGGDPNYVSSYNKMIGDLRDKLSEMKGFAVPITTEDVAEFSNFDGWLRVNDNFPWTANYPLPNVIYSGYAINFGDNSEYEVYTNVDGGSMLVKTAYALVDGVQIGWHQGSYGEYDRFPIWSNYMKKACKAREAGIEFFNMGEVMRKVDFTNDIPMAEVNWIQWNGTETVNMPQVMTGTFKFKGKVMICFTNVSDKVVPIEWEGKPDDMGLKAKANYMISEMYPNKSSKTTLKGCKGNLNIDPYETMLFIIE